jgi:hypothetical protein
VLAHSGSFGFAKPVINLKSGDGCKQAFRKGAEPAVKFSFTMRLKRSINGGSIRI